MLHARRKRRDALTTDPDQKAAGRERKHAHLAKLKTTS